MDVEKKAENLAENNDFENSSRHYQLALHHQYFVFECFKQMKWLERAAFLSVKIRVLVWMASSLLFSSLLGTRSYSDG